MTNQQAWGSEKRQEITPRLVLFAIARWSRWAIPIGLMMAVICAAPLYFLAKPVFEASAWLEIKSVPEFILFQNSGGRGGDFVSTQIEKIRSPVVARMVLEDPEIARLPELAMSEDPVEELIERLEVTRIGNSSLYKTSFQSLSSAGAANVANAVANAYISKYEEGEEEIYWARLTLLNAEQKRRFKELDLLRNQLKEFAKTHGENSIDRTTILIQDSPFQALQTQIIEAEVEQTILAAKIEAAEDFDRKHPVQASIAGIEQELALNAQVQAKLARIDKLRVRKDFYAEHGKGQKNGAGYRRAEQEWRQEFQKLHQLKEALRSDILAKRQAAANHSQQQELQQMKLAHEAYAALRTNLQKKHDEQSEIIRKQQLAKNKQMSVNTVELEIKRAEIGRLEQVYNMITDRILRETTENGAPKQIAFYDPAVVPAGPVEALPWKKLLVAAAAGFCMPFALAVVWEFFHQRVSNSEQLKARMQLTVIGEIAALPTGLGLMPGMRKKRMRVGVRCFRESVDSLRAGLVLSNPLKEAQVLVVTSAISSEGKTSIASQLAVSIAVSTGETPLLVDCDVRSPDIHQLFDVKVSPGVSEMLEGKATLQDAVVHGSDGVDLLPAGECRRNPHAVMTESAIGSLIQELRKSYQYIVLDTPPVLPASESLVMAKMADACLLCVRRDHSRVEQVAVAYEKLNRAGARVAGATLVGVPLSHYAYRYGGYGYYAT